MIKEILCVVVPAVALALGVCYLVNEVAEFDHDMYEAAQARSRACERQVEECVQRGTSYDVCRAEIGY